MRQRDCSENSKYRGIDKMENYTKTKLNYEQTKDAKDLIGLRVLSVSGECLGNISKVRLHPKTNALEGVVCNRGLFRSPSDPCYFAKEYIDRVTDDAALLSIEPALLWIGHEVITSDGKIIGNIKRVQRVGETNEIESFFFKRSWFRTATVKLSAVKKVGTSIVLKRSYAEVKKDGF